MRDISGLSFSGATCVAVRRALCDLWMQEDLCTTVKCGAAWGDIGRTKGVGEKLNMVSGGKVGPCYMW